MEVAERILPRHARYWLVSQPQFNSIKALKPDNMYGPSG
ncbi:hypothetical protein FVEN_g12853 [Fusarium venenatum]|nr:hypothetical protein FVEN_g12853 [Fusarium venenatum]